MSTFDLVWHVAGVVLVPALTWLFVYALISWQRDRAADLESAQADAISMWHLDWAWWSRRIESDNPNTRRLAGEMQAFLQANRPEPRR